MTDDPVATAAQRCGVPTLPDPKTATLFCQREQDHDGSHRVYGGDGKPVREWSRD